MAAVPDHSPGVDTLGAMVAARRVAEAAEREVLRQVVRYAAAHAVPGVVEPGPGIGPAGYDVPVELAGPGAPGVSEFAIADIAAALGLSTVAAKRLVGAGLELRHRLPRIWARIATEPEDDGAAGRAGVAAWRARMVAERTVLLSADAAAYVDAQVAPVIGKVGPVRLARIVEAARTLSEEPEQDELAEQAAQRQVIIDTRGPARLGTAYVDAQLDPGDGLDLEAAVQAAAAVLKDQARGKDREKDGIVEPLAVRRAQALGVIARHYLTTAPTSSSTAARTSTSTRSAGGVELVVHYRPGSDAANLGIAELANVGGLITTDQIGEWCAREGAKVKIVPVVDLAEDLTCGGYVPSPHLRRQVELRDQTCVFPHCTVPAHRADLDHTQPYHPAGPPSQTRSSNLACLCRFHHRLKTHGDWTYDHLAPGWYHWHTPDGRHYLRGPTGTITLT